MEPFEGVYLEIVNNVAFFKSGLYAVGGELAAKNMDDFVHESDIVGYMDSMSDRKWWPDVKHRFEYEAFSRFNKF